MPLLEEVWKSRLEALGPQHPETIALKAALEGALDEAEALAHTVEGVEEGGGARTGEVGEEGREDRLSDAVVLADAQKLAELEAALEANEEAMVALEAEHVDAMRQVKEYLRTAESDLNADVARHFGGLAITGAGSGGGPRAHPPPPPPGA